MSEAAAQVFEDGEADLAYRAKWYGGRVLIYGALAVWSVICLFPIYWTFIPFMMIMLLAGLQALPKEVLEAAKVDGCKAWQSFWQVTFPLMLPVSITAIVIRVIFKLKLADIIINVTAGGPGGATDSVTSFIFREYRDRSNVGYGTLLAMFYLVVIVVGVTLFLALVNRWTRRAGWRGTG